MSAFGQRSRHRAPSRRSARLTPLHHFALVAVLVGGVSASWVLDRNDLLELSTLFGASYEQGIALPAPAASFDTPSSGEALTRSAFSAEVGLGESLVRQALEGFYQAGLRRAYLEVTAENCGAVRLYRTVGFRRAKTLYKAVDG